jgi:uncharacterized protein YodC (DUF2158 family)
MSDTFQPGEMVELKSGGPDMTVEAIQPNLVCCIWFVGADVKRGQFPPAALKKVSPQKYTIA